MRVTEPTVNSPIGVFDSGVGGLTVAAEVFRQLPAEEIVYFGDTAHVPYGGRAIEELIGFADDIVAFLIARGVKVIVDACNTTSSVALDFLKTRYTLPMIGVVEPGVIMALERTVSGRVGVIATEATIMSGAHWKAARQLNPSIQVFGQACPLFVPLVEAGETDSDLVRQVAGTYLAPLTALRIDTLILGCTHYPFLAPVLREILGPHVGLVDPARETVRQLSLLLAERGLKWEGGSYQPAHRFFVSGPARPFQETGQKLLRSAALLAEVKQINPRESDCVL